MYYARKTHSTNSLYIFWFIISILLFELNCVQQSKPNSDSTNLKFFRFQNFEPRSYIQNDFYTNETLSSNISWISERIERQFQDMLDKNNFQRESRGFHFQTSGEDTTVEMEYIIPFANIPIGWSSNFMKASVRKLLNLHTGALIWTGAFVAVGAIIAGVLNTLSALKPVYYNGFYGKEKQNRGLEGEDYDYYINWNKNMAANSSDFGNLLNTKLHENSISLKACIQRSMCKYIKKIKKDIDSGKATNMQKVLDAILRADLVHQYLDGTAVHYAIEAGQSLNCDLLKRRCSWTKLSKKDFTSLLKTFFKND